MADTFQVQVITPLAEFYRGEARFVEFVTAEGEIGIYPRHIPLAAAIYPGVLRIYESGEGPAKKAALISGFARVLPDSVIILAQTAEWPHEIDEERARRAKERAEERLKGRSGTNTLRAELALKRALARLEARK